MTYVIVQCGSSARGDAGPNSDVDIVCVWKKSPPNFDEITERFGEVMTYSYDTILRMKKKGSLFLTHLDIEGKYISGDAEVIKLFRNFRPNNKSNLQNFNTTKDFITNIKWYPDSERGFLWLMDVLYVSLRNCIYCKNALNKVYLFSYKDAIAALNLNTCESAVLLAVREGKYNYRKRHYTKLKVDMTLLQETCAKIVGAPVELTRGGKTNWEKNWDTTYWSERLIERAIINGEHTDNEFMENLLHHNYHKTHLKNQVNAIIAEHRRKL